MVFFGGYCETSSSIFEAWTQKGFLPCFYFTLVPTVLLSCSLVLGALQCVCFAKQSTVMEPKYIPRSCLYTLQFVLTIVLILQFFGYILWEAVGLGIVYGYMIVYCCFSLVGWSCSLILLHLEHTRVLVRDRNRGHGFVLLLFWALAFAFENLAFVSWSSPLWWWSLDKTEEKVHFSLWLIRYVCTAFLFVLGLRAPGLPKKPYMILINEDERDVEHRQSLLGQNQSTQSTWKDFSKKVKLLVPYMWPSGHRFLQILVLLCVCLLGAERAINVFVPIYNKNIDLTQRKKSPQIWTCLLFIC